MFYVYLAIYNPQNKLFYEPMKKKHVFIKPISLTTLGVHLTLQAFFVGEKGPCPQENCIISKIFQEGCMFIYTKTPKCNFIDYVHAKVYLL